MKTFLIVVGFMAGGLLLLVVIGRLFPKYSGKKLFVKYLHERHVDMTMFTDAFLQECIDSAYDYSSKSAKYGFGNKFVEYDSTLQVYADQIRNIQDGDNAPELAEMKERMLKYKIL